jgi:putative membrane protein
VTLPPDQHGVLRRTWLAAERTYLAWLRTGLGAIGVALAVGRLVPALIGGSRVAYGVLGAGWAVLGAFMIVHSMTRARRIDAALKIDGPIPADWWAVIVITIASLALAAATIVIVLSAV